MTRPLVAGRGVGGHSLGAGSPTACWADTAVYTAERDGEDHVELRSGLDTPAGV